MKFYDIVGYSSQIYGGFTRVVTVLRPVCLITVHYKKSMVRNLDAHHHSAIPYKFAFNIPYINIIVYRIFLMKNRRMRYWNVSVINIRNVFIVNILRSVKSYKFFVRIYRITMIRSHDIINIVSSNMNHISIILIFNLSLH